jgi:hypothetical protein
MPIMTSGEYRAVLDQAMARLVDLEKQKQELEVESEKVTQFIFATINMLSDTERQDFIAYLQEASKNWQKTEESLTDAIRELLFGKPKQWFTVAQVRDALLTSGFDFTKYLSNPLASVSTTLKRLVPKDAESNAIEGVNVFRARNTKAAREREAKRSMLRLYRGIFGDSFTDEELQGLLAAPVTTEAIDFDTPTANPQQEALDMHTSREPPNEGE